MTRWRLPAALMFLAVAACADQPVQPTPPITAIINGDPDGTGHPYVGALLDVDFDESGGPSAGDLLCTGSFIGVGVDDGDNPADLFLTAAHCARYPGVIQLQVTFDQDLTDGVASSIAATGTAVAPPLPAGSDLALVFLPRGSAGVTAASLPSAGYLSQRAARNGLKRAEFENVGYGVSAHFKRHPPQYGDYGIRLVSRSRFMALQPHWLGLLMNGDATGLGGDCYGDSGGPKVVPGTSLIVATVTTGDAICRATSWDYRLDTPAARAFLGRYLSLP